MHNVFFAKKFILVLAAVLTLALSPLAAEAGSLTLANGSSSQLNGIYISGSGTNDWEENLIEGYVLPSGNEITI